MDLVKARMRQFIVKTCQASNLEADVNLIEGYPATVNHALPVKFFNQMAKRLLGEESVKPVAYPSMGGEDFAFYLQHVPGCFFFVGMDDGREGGYPSLHHPCYDFNDDALKVGMKMFASLALHWADVNYNPD